MTASKLVLHHRYSGGVAYDLSDHGNHGKVKGPDWISTGPGAGTIRYHGGPDRTLVKKSASLDRLGELHIQVRFLAVPPAPNPNRRLNLVEGEMSFALFVESGWRIGATSLFVDVAPGPISAIGWDGIFTAPGSVTPNQWHTVDYIHDGLTHSRVLLDGVLIGERWNNIGPIQPLGDKGVYIGYWPGDDDRYTFNGNLAEVKIWREEPPKDPGAALDDCCFDGAWVDGKVEEAFRAGWTTERARRTTLDLMDVMRRAATQVRGGDQARGEQMQQLARDAMLAMKVGDQVGFASAVQSVDQMVSTGLSSAARQQLATDLHAAAMASPLGFWLGGTREQAVAFLTESIDAACLGDVVPPRKDRPDRPEHEEPKRPDRPDVPPGDPDTDGRPPDWAGPPRDAPDPYDVDGDGKRDMDPHDPDGDGKRDMDPHDPDDDGDDDGKRDEEDHQ